MRVHVIKNICALQWNEINFLYVFHENEESNFVHDTLKIT